MSIESACSLSEYRNFSNSSPESKRLWKDLPSAVIATTRQFHDLFTIEDYRGKELAVSAVCCLQTLRTNCNSGNEFISEARLASMHNMVTAPSSLRFLATEPPAYLQISKVSQAFVRTKLITISDFFFPFS